MPVEFRCTQCDKLLRTPDETRGQQAKCPACGAVVLVPELPVAAEALPGGVPEPRTDSANPYQAPDDLSGTSPFGTAPAGVRPTKLVFGDAFSETWNIFAEQWAMAIGATLLYLVMFFAAGGMVFGAFIAVAGATESPAAAALVAVFGGILACVFITWIGVGLKLLFIKMARGEEVGIGDLFAGGPYLWRCIAGAVLFSLGILAIALVFVVPCMLVGAAVDEEAILLGMLAGMCLAAVPTTIFSLTFFFYSYLIIDQNAATLDSFSVSRQVTTGNRLMILGIMLLMSLVNAAINQVTCNLGSFVVGPFITLLCAVIYLQAIGHPTAGRRDPQPKLTPPPEAWPPPEA